jgi:WD40 repeat protein
VKTIKYISRSCTLVRERRVLLLTVGVVLLALTLPAAGQRRTTSGIPTDFDDVVFAFDFSPDGRTLAIARGARNPVHRFGRIELWDTETGKLRHLIKGFDGPVRSISFSPDGQTLISSSIEFRTPKVQQKARSREGVTFGELKWWDTRTGELNHKLTLPGEGSFALLATQSPDGKQLALAESFLEQSSIYLAPLFEPQTPNSIGLNRTSYFPFFRSRMKLVDAQTGEPGIDLDVGQPGATIFSPDGNLLAVTSGNEVKLLSTQTGKQVRKLKDLKGTVNAIAFSPTSRNLAVASTKYEREYQEQFIKIIGISEVKLFDVATGKVTLRLPEVGAVNTLAFSPNGRILVVGGVLPKNKGQVAGLKLYDFQTLEVTSLTTGADYKEAVSSLGLSRDGKWLAFSSGPATVKLLNTQQAAVTQTWNADSVGDAVERPTSRFLLSVSRVLAVAFSTDGRSISGENNRGEITLWDHRTGEVKRHLSDQESEPSLVAASLDGKSFAEVSEGQLLFWSANSETKRTVPLEVQETPIALALSTDGRTLALASRSEVKLLSPTGEVAKKLAVLEGVVSRLTFSHDGDLLAGADQFGNVRVWDVRSGQNERKLGTQTEITAMVFAPDGQMFATAAVDKSISLWSLQTGLQQARLQKHDATINALAFSPNSQLLASGGDDRTIVLWEVATAKSKRTFKGHDQTVMSLAFSPDSQLLASGSGNASVVVWEVTTGKLGRVLR